MAAGLPNKEGSLVPAESVFAGSRLPATDFRLHQDDWSERIFEIVFVSLKIIAEKLLKVRGSIFWTKLDNRHDL